MAITGMNPEELTPQYRQYKIVQEIVKRFNEGQLDYLPEKQIEQIAMLAAQHGLEFKVKGKPVKKALFDFADTTLLGMLPNKWRPTSPGQEFHGETGGDKFAGILGTGAGMVLPTMGAFKLAKYAGKGASSLWGMAKNKVGSLNPFRDKIITDQSRLIGRRKFTTAGPPGQQGYFYG